MELFRTPNIDFIGRRFIFLGISAALIVISLVLFFTRGIPLGVDFRGGSVITVRFSERPDENAIRAAMQAAGYKDARIQRYGAPENNEVLIAIEQKADDDKALDAGRQAIIRALHRGQEGKRDLNNIGAQAIGEALLQRDPLRLGTDAATRYADIGRQVAEYRDRVRGGVLKSVDQLSEAGVQPAIIAALKEEFSLSNFGVRNVEIVGPQVGQQLRRQAFLATIYSLIGMLVYLSVRFEWIYGASAVLAVAHDTIITLGVFSLLNQEISLTVIAALLTLIGYSMNDTIVIFDRVRENLKLVRGKKIDEIVNLSVNQTLSRTILTSGLTFLTVVSLFLFGGEVLRGFSLALVVGILIGTYSSFGTAAPILVVYQQFRDGSGASRGTTATTPTKREKARV